MRFLRLNIHPLGRLTILIVFGLILTFSSCKDDDDKRRCGIEGAFAYGPDGECSRCATEDGNIIMGYDSQFCYVPGSYSGGISRGFSFGDSTIAGSVADIYFFGRDSFPNNRNNPYVTFGGLALGYPKGSVYEGEERDPWGYEACKEIEPNTILWGSGPSIGGIRIDPPDPFMSSGCEVSLTIYGFDATGDCHEDWGYASGYADGDTVRLKVYWRAVDFPNPTGDTVLVDSAFIFPLPAYFE